MSGVRGRMARRRWQAGLDHEIALVDYRIARLVRAVRLSLAFTGLALPVVALAALY